MTFSAVGYAVHGGIADAGATSAGMAASPPSSSRPTSAAAAGPPFPACGAPRRRSDQHPISRRQAARGQRPSRVGLTTGPAPWDGQPRVMHQAG